MKAIFPDSKSLQPMPTPNVHANVSGSVNNNTVVTPEGNATTQNISTTQNEISTVTPPDNAKSISLIFSFIAFMIVVVIIIITHKRLKR
jgi:ATP-dependent Zn protease